jgi:hypothetical protein
MSIEKVLKVLSAGIQFKFKQINCFDRCEI